MKNLYFFLFIFVILYNFLNKFLTKCLVMMNNHKHDTSGFPVLRNWNIKVTTNQDA